MTVILDTAHGLDSKITVVITIADHPQLHFFLSLYGSTALSISVAFSVS
jgi:hypothetical protein